MMLQEVKTYTNTRSISVSPWIFLASPSQMVVPSGCVCANSTDSDKDDDSKKALVWV